MGRNEQNPFAELPEALVEEMLSMSESVGDELFIAFKQMQDDRDKIRRQLQDNNLLKRDSDFGYPGIPTTCGADGSYVVERLLANDLVACAAVAVEGLTPPSEKRFWERPYHRAFIYPEKHDDDTTVIIRALMMEMELELAAKAPHDIVFLDGSLTTPLIYMNQAINKVEESEKTVISEKLTSQIESFLNYYKIILESSRTDKLWVSVPKYTTRRELGEKLNWSPRYDDRAILTSILSPGEFTSPILLKQPQQLDQSQQLWHLRIPNDSKSLKSLKDEVLSAMDRIHVLYYKPNNWMPALRIEVSSSIATNNSRIGILLQGFKYQCGTPGIFEPYPLYMADRMVKHLSRAIPAFRQTAIKRMAENYEGDVSDIFFNMHGYRTESRS
jgi:hypothetical protein